MSRPTCLMLQLKVSLCQLLSLYQLTDTFTEASCNTVPLISPIVTLQSSGANKMPAQGGTSLRAWEWHHTATLWLLVPYFRSHDLMNNYNRIFCARAHFPRKGSTPFQNPLSAPDHPLTKILNAPLPILCQKKYTGLYWQWLPYIVYASVGVVLGIQQIGCVAWIASIKAHTRSHQAWWNFLSSR